MNGPKRASWGIPARPGYRRTDDYERDPDDSDAYVLNVLHQISVSPLSLDMSSRVDLEALERLIQT